MKESTITAICGAVAFTAFVTWAGWLGYLERATTRDIAVACVSAGGSWQAYGKVCNR